MVTRTLHISLQAVPISTVNDTHASSPLAQRLDADILRRRGRGAPVRIDSGQRVPDTDRVVQTQLSVVAYVAGVQLFQSAEGVAHKGVHPLCERGAGLEQRSDSLAELASGDVVSQREIEGEEPKCQLPA